MSGQLTAYRIGFGAAAAVGVATTVVAVAGLFMLGVAHRAETQLAHLEDWMPTPPWLVEP